MVVLVPAPGDLGHMHSFLWAAVSFSVQEKELSLPFRVGKRAWAAAVYILGTQKKKKKTTDFILFPSGKLFAFWKVGDEGGEICCFLLSCE